MRNDWPLIPDFTVISSVHVFRKPRCQSHPALSLSDCLFPCLSTTATSAHVLFISVHLESLSSLPTKTLSALLSLPSPILRVFYPPLIPQEGGGVQEKFYLARKRADGLVADNHCSILHVFFCPLKLTLSQQGNKEGTTYFLVSNSVIFVVSNVQIY